MQYWILKTEPFKYSWEDLNKDGKTFWDGVRNYQARNNMQDMKKGDLAYIYHSNKGLEIVGIAMIIKEAYQDPTTDDDRWVAVDIAPVQPMTEPVSLKALKSNPKLEDLAMIKQGRLSVSPVTTKEWNEILKMGKTKL